MAAIQRDRTRTALLFVAGIAAAALWMLIAELFGAQSAHADTRPSGLADDLISVVEDAVPRAAPLVSDVATTVAPLIDPVEEVIAPVQQHVVAPLAPVLAPVQQVLESRPVAAVTAPVVDLVTAVPVVGDLVTGLGVDSAVETASASVDTVAGGLLPAVVGPTSGTGTILPDMQIPAADRSMAAAAPPASDAGAEASAVAPVDPAAASATLLTAVRTLWSMTAGALVEPFAAATAGLTDSTVAPISPSGSLATPFSGVGASLAGPGGTGFALWALVAAGAVFAHRAWVRRRSWTDDALPAGPVGKADVSPD